MSTLISSVCSACFPLDALHRYLPVTDLSLFNVNISSPDDNSKKKTEVNDINILEKNCFK